MSFYNYKIVVPFFFFLFWLQPVLSQKSEIDSLVSLLNSDSDTSQVNILCALSEKYTDINPEKALSYSKQARLLAQSVSYKKGVANSCFNIAKAYHAKSDNIQALAFLNIAQQIFFQINDLSRLSDVYSTIGNIQMDLGSYKPAMDFSLKALKIREDLKDSLSISSSYLNIGSIYESLKDYDKALGFYSQSLAIRNKMNYLSGVADCYNNMANIYSAKGDFNKALELLELSLKIKEKIGNKKGIAHTLNNIGGIYTETGRYEKAREYYLKSYEIKKQINDTRGIVGALSNIGAGYFFTKDFKNANKYFLLASSQAQMIGAKDLLLINYQNAVETYNELKDYKNAVLYYQYIIELKDSILNIESSKAMHEMQAKFNFEKQEKEIKILTQKNEIQDLEVSRQRLFKNGFIIGFVLILILAFVLLNRYQLKQKANAKLESQKQEIVRQHNALNIAYEQIEAKNKDITDSIKYAKRIQEAILPTNLFESQFKTNGFIFYKPKDIVSGDFYWMSCKNDFVFVAAVDCTGHGVPGAFMSIVGYNLLNQAVNEHEILVPSDILNEINKGITNTLRQYQDESTVKDGMDIALCRINIKTKELQYAGAYNPLWLVDKNGKFSELKGNKFPVGAFVGEKMNMFTNHTLQLAEGDSVYMFTDGFADQFGGPKGKKFKYKQLQEIIINNASLPMSSQRYALEQAFLSWIGNIEQIDDVLIMGIRM